MINRLEHDAGLIDRQLLGRATHELDEREKLALTYISRGGAVLLGWTRAAADQVFTPAELSDYATLTLCTGEMLNFVEATLDADISDSIIVEVIECAWAHWLHHDTNLYPPV